MGSHFSLKLVGLIWLGELSSGCQAVHAGTEHTFLMDRAKMLPKRAGVSEQKTHFGYERMLSPRQALPVRLTLGDQPSVLKESKQLALAVLHRRACQKKHS